MTGAYNTHKMNVCGEIVFEEDGMYASLSVSEFQSGTKTALNPCSVVLLVFLRLDLQVKLYVKDFGRCLGELFLP